MTNTFTIFGARGSLSNCQAYTIKYGGHTTCFGIELDDHIIVLDMGTGLQQLGFYLQSKETLPNMSVLFTHYHLDHTHGNPAFEAGTRVMSTERTLSHLKALDAGFWEGEAGKLLPNETFVDRRTLEVGGKTIELIHPGAGHTDGELR